ncbi:MAG TPA: PAS domain S-box protein [Terracidiphilus sp.]|nr:PAS domain S-box protein [Terracidiphilus sp.]
MESKREKREPSEQASASGYAAAYLAVLTEGNGDLIWSVDLNYRLVTFNKALSDAFARGYGVKIAAGMTPRDMLPPEKAAFFPPHYEQALCEGPCAAEYRLVDGSYLGLTFNPIVQDGRKVGVSVIGKDVTRQKSVQEALRRTAEQYRQFFEFAPEAIYRITREGKTVVVNPAGARLLGYDSPGEAISVLNDWGRQVWFDPAERAAFIGEVERQGEARSDPHQFRRKDGTLLWGVMTERKICGPDGETLYLQGFLEDITERKAAEEALRESEARYRRLFENSQFGIYRSTPGGRVVLVSPSLLAMLGYTSKEELAQRNLESEGFEPAYDRRWFKEVLERDGIIRNHEATWTRRDGKTLYVLESAVAVRDSEGAVLYYDGTVVDITERKQALDALRASEARLKKAEQLALFGNSTWDAETDMTTWSEGLYRITGRDPSTPPPHHAERTKLYTPESFALLDAAVGYALSAGDPYDLELQIVRADGALRWTRARGESVRNESGRVCKLIGTLQDITDQKLLEEKLRSSEESYRAVFQQAAVGIVQTSIEGVFLRCNPRFAEIVGYPPEEIPGMTFQQITAPEDLAASVGVSRQMTDGQIGSSAWEKRYIRKDGSSTWARITVSLQRDTAGQPIHRIALVEDINVRKAAQEALEKAEKKFREIFEDAPEGIFQTTKEGRSLALNTAGAKLLGFPTSGAAVTSITDSAHDVWLNPEDRARYTQLLEEQGEIHDFLCQFKRADGMPIWVSLTARRICGQDGKTLYYQGFIEDVTEQKALEVDLGAKVRELSVLSEMNNALLHAKTEEELLTEYCRIVVEVGGYRMAWVGFADEGPEKLVISIAHYGHEDGYLKLLNLTWANTKRGQGPTGRCIRTGEICASRDVAKDPMMKPWRKEALKRGYMSSIAVPFRQFEGERACLTAYGVRVSRWSDAERRLMNQVASALGYGITMLRTAMAKAQYQESLSVSLEQTIQVIAETVEQRDPYTAGHQRRVADLCVAIAGKLGLPSERTQGLRLAAGIHDLGKIGIPAEILAKPGDLTEHQYNLLKEHVQLGYEIVKNVQFPWPIAQMILQHHERLDGSGYPQGLKADEILIESRILAVADVVEAMSSHRPYRASRGINAALDEVQSGSGALYDPEAVEACVNLFSREGYQFPPQ